MQIYVLYFSLLPSLYPFLLNRVTVSSLILSPPPSLRSFPFSAPFFFLCGFSLVPCHPLFIKEYAFRRRFRFISAVFPFRSFFIPTSFPFRSLFVPTSFPSRSRFVPFLFWLRSLFVPSLFWLHSLRAAPDSFLLTPGFVPDLLTFCYLGVPFSFPFTSSSSPVPFLLPRRFLLVPFQFSFL